MRKLLIPLLVSLLLAGCSMQAGLPGAGPSTPYIITSTLAPTTVPSITPTPPPPTPTPTTVPVEGMTTTQVNVRTSPSSAAAQITMLAPFQKVQIIGQDPSSNWYEINYPGAPGGVAWVTAQYINVPRDKDRIPVVGGAPTQGAASTGTPGSTASAVVNQQINVRSGPGIEFDALGTLNPKDVVTLTGRDPAGDWFQIAYSGTAGGTGWIAAAFVTATGADSLPIVGAAGSPTGTPPPPGITPAVPSPTLGAAFPDEDSAQAPAVVLTFSAAGTHSLLYSSDLSAPSGDAEDWVQFTPFTAGAVFNLTCTGNAGIAVQLSSSGVPVAQWPGIDCGGARSLQLATGAAYLVHLSIVPGASASYVRYTLRIDSTG